jgi:hypothetical protein
MMDSSRPKLKLPMISASRATIGPTTLTFTDSSAYFPGDGLMMNHWFTSLP